MAKYRMVRTDFWNNPLVIEEMSPEDKYFYLYLLTNPQTTQCGIYKIAQKQMAFDLGYSIEGVQSLMDRFICQYKLIRYNPVTRELAIKYWGKDNLENSGKPVIDCIASELKEVEDRSLIHYVAESIRNQEIRSLYESFFVIEEDTYMNGCNEVDDSLPCRPTIRGQKEKEKEKEKQQQKDLYPSIENNPGEEIEEMIGMNATTVKAKQQLSLLEDLVYQSLKNEQCLPYVQHFKNEKLHKKITPGNEGIIRINSTFLNTCTQIKQVT